MQKQVNFVGELLAKIARQGYACKITLNILLHRLRQLIQNKRSQVCGIDISYPYRTISQTTKINRYPLQSLVLYLDMR